MVKQALNHAKDNLLGEQMMFFLIDWVEQNFYSIIERPGKLREISAAASTVSEVQPVRRKPKISRHPRPLTWAPNPKSKEDWTKRQAEPKLQTMLQGRRNLPAWEMRETIIDMVNSHQVTIVSFILIFLLLGAVSRSLCSIALTTKTPN
jgi:ATP-dependent RNA helicase DHX57